MHDLSSPAPPARLTGHSSWVLSACLAPAADYCVSASSDKSVRVWDIGKRECVQTLQEVNHTDQVTCLPISARCLCC